MALSIRILCVIFFTSYHSRNLQADTWPPLKHLETPDLTFKKDPTKPLVVQFWAAWCRSCGTILWDIDQLIRPTENNIQFIMISLDESSETALATMKQHGLYQKYKSYQFFAGGKQLAKHLNVQSVPEIHIFSASGQPLKKINGHLTATEKRQISTTLNIAKK